MREVRELLLHICHGGPVVQLRVGKITHTFEMHNYCGPIKLLCDGYTPAKRQWTEKSQFWDVFSLWMQNGQKVNKFGIGLI